MDPGGTFDEYITRAGLTVLQSIDLTRLPHIPPSGSSRKSSEKQDTKPGVEYSSREVSPPALLIQQLLQAHSIFCLHHGPSLSDLFVRLTRDKFCNTLDRFWSRFSKSWDVLLHGSPAVDIFGGLKLASGGELGYGVGEEEWGSGERAVLEDLTRHTEGLVDVVVSRFGNSPSRTETKPGTEDDQLPWMGSGAEPTASDGVVFSGVGALERQSLADVSTWIRRIYTYGDYAYGVRDNPLRERQKRRRRSPHQGVKSSNGSIGHAQERDPEQSNLQSASEQIGDGDSPKAHQSGRNVRTDRSRPAGDTRSLSVEDARPNIPPPIVSAAEDSLKKATHQAEQDRTDTEDTADEAGTTLGIPDQYMKYLTFGLSTLGKAPAKKSTTSSEQGSGIGQQSLRPPNDHQRSKNKDQALLSGDEDDAPMMSHLEPMPDGDTIKARIASQKHLEKKGYFLIGLKGDLDDLDEEDAVLSDASTGNGFGGSRIVLRTLQVQMVHSKAVTPVEETTSSRTSSNADDDVPEHPMKHIQRLRALVYVRQPFIYCFLFENRTSSLQYTKFYKVLHLNLAPIYKPLLASTDPAKAADRIESSRITASESETLSVSSASRSPSKRATTNPIYHLIYDPRLLTMNTSLPNIPEPGTPAAEGILTALTGVGDGSTRTSWTRSEAMNVHSQVLNTLASVRGRSNEVERTSKTSRGWWVVWMKVRPSDVDVEAKKREGRVGDDSNVLNEETSSNEREVMPSISPADGEKDLHRIAFLVRKASESTTAPKPPSTSSRAMNSMLSNMSFGLAGRDEDDTGGASAGFGPAALAGGIGVDAKKYVDGLLTSLNK